MHHLLKRLYMIWRTRGLYWYALRDRRTGPGPKLAMLLAAGYALWPVDIIPLWVPVLGVMDDIAIVAVLLTLARRMIPPAVVADYLGIQPPHSGRRQVKATVLHSTPAGADGA